MPPPHLLANHPPERNQHAQPHQGVGGLGQVERHRLALGGFEGHVRKVPGERAPPLLDLLESVPHQARLHALEPVAPPVELAQVCDLPVPERVAGAVGGGEFPLQGCIPFGIFAQGAHDGGFVFGRGITAVLEGVHFHALFSGLAAGPGGALRIAPSGVEPLGSKTSRFA